MKKPFLILALLGCMASASAAIWQFDLGPGGLNGLNERPIPVITTATGGETAPGISYDDVSKRLTLNFAYGTDHGFTDLSSSLNTGGAHIHGPVTDPIPTEGAAGVLYSIFSLINQTSATDGVASGFVQFVDLQAGAYPIAAQEADLMAGKYYVNLHTANFGGGEIRGQLLLVPEPQTYATIAGLALLGFAGWRRRKATAA
jgi:hypothetical protein